MRVMRRMRRQLSTDRISVAALCGSTKPRSASSDLRIATGSLRGQLPKRDLIGSVFGSASIPRKGDPPLKAGRIEKKKLVSISLHL